MYSLKKKIVTYFSIVWILGVALIIGVSFINFRGTILEMIELFPEKIEVILKTDQFSQLFLFENSESFIMELFIQKYKWLFISILVLSIIVLITTIFGLGKIFDIEFGKLNESLTFDGNIKDSETLPIEFSALLEKMSDYEQKVLEMQHQNKMFQSYATHELRNELVTTKGLLHQYDIKEEKIFKHQVSLENMVDDLLLLSYVSENLVLETVDPLVSCALIVDRFDNGQLVFEFDEDDNWKLVMAKKSWLERVFYNLVDNALKYSEGNEKVLILAQATDEACIFTIQNSTNLIDGSQFPKEKYGHGIGLRLVEHVVDSLEGVYYYEIANQKVTSIITLPWN